METVCLTIPRFQCSALENLNNKNWQGLLRNFLDILEGMISSLYLDQSTFSKVATQNHIHWTRKSTTSHFIIAFKLKKKKYTIACPVVVNYPHFQTWYTVRTILPVRRPSSDGTIALRATIPPPPPFTRFFVVLHLLINKITGYPCTLVY